MAPQEDVPYDGDYFWGYLAMVTVVGDILLGCHQWAERCACHDDLGAGLHSYHKRRHAFMSKYKVTVPGCPMRTRRAPRGGQPCGGQ